MIQMCRFCSKIYLQDDDIAWCEVINGMINSKEGSRPNACEQFEFNELDVFLEGVEGDNNEGWLTYDEYITKGESPKWNIPDNNQTTLFKESDTDG